MNDVINNPKELPGYEYAAMDQFTARTVDESSFLESVLDDLEDIPAKKIKTVRFLLYDVFSTRSREIC